MRDMLKSFLSLICIRTSVFWLYVLCLGHMLFRGWLECDPDLFTRMGLARLMFEAGRVPTSDPFAWTPRLPAWIDHEWLSGVVFYEVYRHLGDWGLYCLKLICVATTALILRATYRLHANFSGVALTTLLLILFGSSFLWFSTVRCQVFTYLFLAFTLYAIEAHRLRQKRWPLMVLIPAMIAWVNLHGGFALGIILVSLYAIAETWTAKKPPLFLVGIISLLCLATLCNPYGTQLLVTVYEALAKPRELIDEWGAVNPLSLQALVISGALVVVLSSLVVDRQRFSRPELLILCFCFFCGYRHARLIPLALFAFFSLHAWGIERRLAFIREFSAKIALDRVLSVYAFVLWIPGLITTTGLVWNRERFTLDYSSYPVAAINWAKENAVSAKMLTPFREGGYVLWSAYPKLLVSMDGRYEAVYPEETFRLNAAVYAPNTTDRFKRAFDLGADSALFPSALVGTPSEYELLWTVGYRDDGWTILIRREDRVSSEQGVS